MGTQEEIDLYTKNGAKSLAMLSLERIYTVGKFGPYDLLLGKNDVPAGLSSSFVWNAVYRKRRKRIRKDFLDYLVKTFLEHDRIHGHDQWIELTEATSNFMKKERERTGLSLAKFIANAENCPEGLTPTLISHWIHRRVKTINKEFLSFVLTEWEKYPDSPKYTKKKWLEDVARQYGISKE